MNILSQQIAAAATFVGSVVKLNAAPRNLTVQATFAAGTGGTSADVYLQTSLDGGANWIDIANFHFLTTSALVLINLSAATPKTTAVTPTDGALAANTAVDGILGSMFRCKGVSVGTYAGAQFSIDIASDQVA
jgi:triacylglycerol esterase/lipase EstA (alpha/beta hydrolase family)